MGEYSGHQYDVIIIGGGIMGSCTAYQVAKRGSKALLLEQFDLLHSRGSSHGESRTIRATYPEDYYSSMVVQSSALWEEAQLEIGYEVYFKTPHFDMGPSGNKSLVSLISNCDNNSYPFEKLGPEQVRTRFAGRFDIPANWVGVCSGVGGVIKPTKAVSMFQTLAGRNGAVLRDNTQVTGIEKAVKGGVWVFTADGEKFWGKKCVVTAGAWTGKLVKNVTGLELPIRVLETAVHYWKVKEGHEGDFTIGSGFPTFASYGVPYIYGTPSLEFPGLIKIAIHGGHPCDPDKRPWGPGLDLDPVREWIRERFMGLVDDNGPACTQLCMYSMTPDEDFVIDFLGGEFGDDVVVGGGFSGHGFKMGPVVGRILADLALTGMARGVELSHFRIQRFQENPKGNAKDFEEQVNSCQNGK